MGSIMFYVFMFVSAAFGVWALKEYFVQTDPTLTIWQRAWKALVLGAAGVWLAISTWFGIAPPTP